MTLILLGILGMLLPFGGIVVRLAYAVQAQANASNTMILATVGGVGGYLGHLVAWAIALSLVFVNSDVNLVAMFGAIGRYAETHGLLAAIVVGLAPTAIGVVAGATLAIWLACQFIAIE